MGPGLRWGRLPVPGSLRHINIWLLEDGDGHCLVDTGLDNLETSEAWDALFHALNSAGLTRIICTHYHPDHIGMAGSLCRKWDVPLWMTRGEWAFARMLASDVRDAPPREAFTFWRAAGWSQAQIEAQAAKGWGGFASMVSEIPASYVRLQDGDSLTIGSRRWEIICGNGHSPEHACLLDREAKLLIAGDQVLPRITSNVSVTLSEPEGDPLGDWLDSIAKLKRLPDDLLVLPSHGEPFTGLHARLDSLDRGHRERLDALSDFLATPRRAVDCFPILFGRAIDQSLLPLATGEALAHLRRLELEGRARSKTRAGVKWFEAI